MQISELLSIADELAEQFKCCPSVRGIYVYGSAAHGDVWYGSNIDMVVLVDDSSSRVAHLYVDVADERRNIKVEFMPARLLGRVTLSFSSYSNMIQRATVARVRILYDPDQVIKDTVERVQAFETNWKSACILNMYGKAARSYLNAVKYATMKRWAAAVPFICSVFEQMGLALCIVNECLPRKSWVEDLQFLEPDFYDDYTSADARANEDCICKLLDKGKVHLERLAPTAIDAIGTFVDIRHDITVSDITTQSHGLNPFEASAILEILVKAGIAEVSSRQEIITLGQSSISLMAKSYRLRSVKV